MVIEKDLLKLIISPLQAVNKYMIANHIFVVLILVVVKHIILVRPGIVIQIDCL